MTSSRLSKNSYSLQEFNKTIPDYQLALEKSGYREKLTYVKEELKKNKNRSIQLNLKKPIKKKNTKDFLVQPPFQ